MKDLLEQHIPDRGAARDAYDVAALSALLVARVLAHRFDKPPDGWHRNDCARHAVRLAIVSGRLHRIAERECNEDLACPRCHGEGEYAPGNSGAPFQRCPKCAGDGRTTGRAKARARAEATAIAEHYGLRCYFQTDPRGCALYLIDPAIIPLIPSPEIANLLPDTRLADVESVKEAQRRWIEANYTQGHAVTRLGR